MREGFAGKTTCMREEKKRFSKYFKKMGDEVKSAEIAVCKRIIKPHASLTHKLPFQTDLSG